MKGSSHGQLEVVPRHLPREAEEGTKDLQLGVPAAVRSRYLPNTITKHCRLSYFDR
jgi:hypothetical protein